MEIQENLLWKFRRFSCKKSGEFPVKKENIIWKFRRISHANSEKFPVENLEKIAGEIQKNFQWKFRRISCEN